MYLIFSMRFVFGTDYLASFKTDPELDIFQKVCENVQTLATLTNPFLVRPVPWRTTTFTPAGPVPSIIMAAIAPDSAITDFCNLYNNILSGNLIDGALMMADFGNKMAGNKFDEELIMARSTSDLYFTLFDDPNGNFSGEFRTDQLFSTSTMGGINSYLSDINDYQEAKSGLPQTNFVSREVRERRMVELADNAKQLALLNELMRCPTAVAFAASRP